VTLQNDPASRLERAKLALDGLSVGDGFGERFFVVHPDLLRERRAPRGPWRTTDDTEMATVIADVLALGRGIDRDLLARAFAARYRRDPARGYGGTAHQILSAIGEGTHWTRAAGEAFGGQGSCGNGGAMRVAPIAGYFADDLDALIDHARRSAEVTHAHAEGQAGAIAAALAGAYACDDGDPSRLLDFVIEHTPAGETRQGLEKARALDPRTDPWIAASQLGNGSRVIAQDTVSYALWCAARHLASFEAALWTAVSVGGDIDTLGAIVGGIVALRVGRAGIPALWLEWREKLRHDDLSELG